MGAVIIGRNEGERFVRCLDSLIGQAEPIVYVDSGSTDGSIEYAQSKGVEVVDLDASIPFTAARARNAGFYRLSEMAPDVSMVMFVDGDCEVCETFIPAAVGFLDENAEHAVACGRRKERFPEASVYNYLCDVEWNTPVGDAKACGGDAVMRAEAFAEVKGFNPELIAGEEPELCVRLREANWKIRRLDETMTLHDANVTQFSQWWQRSVRSGHAFAEGADMHGAPLERHWVQESRRAVVWGLAIPLLALLLSPFASGLSLMLLLLYPVNVARIAGRLRRQGEPRPWTVASFLMLSKFPEAIGWLRYTSGKLTGKRSKLIEYK